MGSSGGQPTHVTSNQKPCYRIALIGDSNVGKTTLVRRYHSGQFLPPAPTVGADHVLIERTDPAIGEYKVRFLDTAGSEQYNAYAKIALHSCDCALLMWSVDEEKSLDNLGTWLNTVSQNAPPDLPVFVLGSKCDMQEGIQNTNPDDVKRRLAALQQNWDNIQCTHLVSAKEPGCGEDLEALMSDIINNEAVTSAQKVRESRESVKL